MARKRKRKRESNLAKRKRRTGKFMRKKKDDVVFFEINKGNVDRIVKVMSAVPETAPEYSMTSFIAEHLQHNRKSIVEGNSITLALDPGGRMEAVTEKA